MQNGNKKWEFVQNGNKKWEIVQNGNKKWEIVQNGNKKWEIYRLKKVQAFALGTVYIYYYKYKNHFMK